MLTGELRSQTLPYLHLYDSVSLALQLISDNQVSNLPVVDGDKFVGTVNEDHLQMADDDTAEIASLQPLFSTISVKESDHFLKAVQLAGQYSLSVVPVTDSNNDMVGVVAYSDLLRQASEFMSLDEPGGLIVLEVESNQYSFSEISKIIETNDAQITQLNTSNDLATGMMQITIRVNKPEVSDIIATFQRYEYTIRYYFGEENYVNEIKSNYDNLMNYLKI